MKPSNRCYSLWQPRPQHLEHGEKYQQGLMHISFKEPRNTACYMHSQVQLQVAKVDCNYNEGSMEIDKNSMVDALERQAQSTSVTNVNDIANAENSAKGQ